MTSYISTGASGLEHLSQEDTLAVERARALSRLMDDRFHIAGFGIGLDGLIGLIPVAGDIFSSVMGLFHLRLAHQLRLGIGTYFKIVLNLIIDFIIGFIPLVGDFFDFGFKSHRRNMKLIEKKIIHLKRKTS
jgi:hypothetical protein